LRDVFFKQNSVIRLKSNILPPSKFLGWLRHCLVVLVLPNTKRRKKGKEFFDEEGVKVFICWNKYLARILLPA